MSIFDTDAFLYFVTAFAIGLFIWGQLRGSPASDVDKAELVELCNGDIDAEAIVRSIFKKKQLQKIDCVRTYLRIQALHDAKHAKAVIAEFQKKT